MKYVYILQSLPVPSRRYTGITFHCASRLKFHNDGFVPSTAKHKPWKLVVSIGFADESGAWAFERYLKSGAGKEFARRHFF